MNKSRPDIFRQRCLFLCLFFAAVCFSPIQAHAARFSGEYFLKVCALDKQGEELVPGGKIACQAYISAVIDYHNFLRTLDSAGPRSFCLPEETSLNEVHLIVLLYFLKNKKLHRNFIAAPGVEMALMDAYPCQRKKKKKG
ncbi:MAG: hypothetical protein KA099_04805 [Alphaproteobacteria bacterium]|nr:hypothetical protein [Alphaproteobacteria bacterium]MBP7758853.1 hypothetical protein [Alphaproteobacteria bacterium]MBP7904630.1 hypothetical protein [Alphaproteobacteria bacterium]